MFKLCKEKIVFIGLGGIFSVILTYPKGSVLVPNQVQVSFLSM